MRRMMRLATMLLGLAAIATIATALSAADKPSDLLGDARDTFGKLPDKMPGSESDTPAEIKLGKKLYFETAMSINRTQSCNSCHRIDEGLGGVDNKPTSPGAKGKFGDRNAPTVLNAGFHVAQFWDGRAKDLAEQAKGPVLNPIEMGMPSEAIVMGRVKDLSYVGMFKEAFPGQDNPVTYQNVAEAIAAFERTLITKDRFDDYLGGKEKALTDAEQKGLAVFMEIGCADCHSGPLLGGDQYEKMGDVNPYANKEDLGRYNVTKKEDDKYVFKVPSLRNIAITHPYFHDGKAATLPEAVRQMAHLQLDMKPTGDQVDQIVAFLGSLTDRKRAKAQQARQ